MGTSFALRRRPVSQTSVGVVPRAAFRWDLADGLAAITLALVVAAWVSRTLAALRIGMTSPDPLWYPLPAAVRFEQT